MNKKLITLAVAAAFAAPMAASAEATIYGSLHTSVERLDAKNGAGQKLTKNWDVASNDGQLGIKGSEDLGGSLKGLYKIEVDVFPAGGDLASQTRDAAAVIDEIWVGLTGNWGTALIGREDTPYKTFLDSAGVDILGDSIVDIDTHLAGVGGGGFERFTANGAIAYVSPNFSGFTVGAAVIPGGQEPAVPDGSVNSTGNDIKDGIGDHYSIGANYIGGGLKVAAAYEKKVPVDNGTVPVQPNSADQKNLGVAASYTFNNFFIGGKYEDEDGAGWAKDIETKRYAVTGKFSFGNNAIGAVYGKSKTKDPSVTLNDSRGWGLFAEHNFSNRTKVYVAYNDSKNKQSENDPFDPADLDNGAFDAAKEKAFAVGVVHNF